MSLLNVSTFSSFVPRMVKYQVDLSVLPRLLSYSDETTYHTCLQSQRCRPSVPLWAWAACLCGRCANLHGSLCVLSGERHGVGMRSLVFEYWLGQSTACSWQSTLIRLTRFVFFGRVRWWGKWVLISIHPSLHPVLMEFFKQHVQSIFGSPSDVRIAIVFVCLNAHGSCVVLCVSGVRYGI